MVEGSGPSDQVELEAEDIRVSERLKRLEEAIGELEAAQRLRPDAAARLAKYRESHERLQFVRSTLDWKLQQPHPQAEPDPTIGPVTEEMPRRPGKKDKKRCRWLP